MQSILGEEIALDDYKLLPSEGELLFLIVGAVIGFGITLCATLDWTRAVGVMMVVIGCQTTACTLFRWFRRKVRWVDDNSPIQAKRPKTQNRHGQR